MPQPNPNFQFNYRIGDTDRNDAVTALSVAFGEGRLSMDEFDRRCAAVAKAEYSPDLMALFQDLPQKPGQCQVPAQQVQNSPVYTGEDIELARKRGRNVRGGLLGLSTIASLAFIVVFSEMGENFLAVLSLLIIPTVFILLYVMKVGPGAAPGGQDTAVGVAVASGGGDRDAEAAAAPADGPTQERCVEYRAADDAAVQQTWLGSGASIGTWPTRSNQKHQNKQPRSTRLLSGTGTLTRPRS